MSQATDSFEEAEERMSDEELEYSEEPASWFSDSSIIADENSQEVVNHFADPEEVQARATQTQTTTTIRLQPSLWAEPSNIQRAAGENPPSGGGSSGGGGGGGGGNGGGGGGNPLLQEDRHQATPEEETTDSLDNPQTYSRGTARRQKSSSRNGNSTTT